MKNINLKPFNSSFLKEIWKQGFSNNKPKWIRFNAPYFDDYQKFSSFLAFKNSEITEFLLSNDCRCITVNNHPIGMVSRDWINEQTRWLEIGIVIYDSTEWSSGYGTTALQIWIDEIFQSTDQLEHIGLTTWSGNPSMMRVAEKLGFQKEAQIRKVRYYKGIYYDSVKYGILRDEWANKRKDSDNVLKSNRSKYFLQANG